MQLMVNKLCGDCHATNSYKREINLCTFQWGIYSEHSKDRRSRYFFATTKPGAEVDEQTVEVALVRSTVHLNFVLVHGVEDGAQTSF